MGPVCAPLAACISASGTYRAPTSHRAFASAWTSLPRVVTAPDYVPMRMGLGLVSPLFTQEVARPSMDQGLPFSLPRHE